MSLFRKIVEERNRTGSLNLIKCIEELEPLTPQEIKVEMSSINMENIKSCILFNVYSHHLNVSNETANSLLQYLETDFEGIPKLMYIQVFLHLVKQEVNGASVEEKSEQLRIRLLTYIRLASSPTSAWQYEIREVEPNLTIKIKEALQKEVVTKAFIKTLRLIDSDMKEQEITEAINKMDIFVVHQFLPCPFLRGACLHSGILMSESLLAPPVGSCCHMADLVSLSVHETIHYLARLSNNNLNFSSPFSFDPIGRTVKNPDLINEDLTLEMGQAVEKALFDGNQLSWWNCTEKGAEVILSRLETYTDPPLVRNEEFSSLGLVPRSTQSAGFGVDFQEIDFFE